MQMSSIELKSIESAFRVVFIMQCDDIEEVRKRRKTREEKYQCMRRERRRHIIIWQDEYLLPIE